MKNNNKKGKKQNGALWSEWSDIIRIRKKITLVLQRMCVTIFVE